MFILVVISLCFLVGWCMSYFKVVFLYVCVCFVVVFGVGFVRNFEEVFCFVFSAYVLLCFVCYGYTKLNKFFGGV